jgi:hypothetical protein
MTSVISRGECGLGQVQRAVARAHRGRCGRHDQQARPERHEHPGPGQTRQGAARLDVPLLPRGQAATGHRGGAVRGRERSPASCARSWTRARSPGCGPFWPCGAASSSRATSAPAVPCWPSPSRSPRPTRSRRRSSPRPRRSRAGSGCSPRRCGSTVSTRPGSGARGPHRGVRRGRHRHVPRQAQHAAPGPGGAAARSPDRRRARPPSLTVEGLRGSGADRRADRLDLLLGEHAAAEEGGRTERRRWSPSCPRR